jgi:alkylation response protein AidB-like acyl-CoA dehydrogenase
MALLAGSLGVAGCVLAAAGATAAERARQSPAAAEDLQLRAACADWAEQIREGNVVRSALYQEHFSRYSPRTNRCYVEIRVQTGDLNEQSDRFGRYLYDGQTRELLAFAQIQNGKKSGKVFDLNHRTTSFENAGWDDASQYIYTMMAGDRR